MSEYHTKRAAEILNTIRYATIATVTEDAEPWNSPVAHELDSNLTIYWVSDKENQHSKNVRANGQAFIVIYDSTVREGDGEGVYLKVDVIELSDADEILYVRRLRKGDDYQSKEGEFLGNAVRRIYKAVPKAMWMNDAEMQDGVFIRDYKVELDLADVRQEFSKLS